MLIVLVLICGAVAGAAVSALALRRSRERTRAELASLSAEVLSRTGESLAGRMADARRAEEERAAGEMARRTEEIKGVVGPVGERLVRMESEIGRLERERVRRRASWRRWCASSARASARCATRPPAWPRR